MATEPALPAIFTWLAAESMANGMAFVQEFLTDGQ